MKKFKAFTLLELLFVMILTTIIIGIGYVAFTISIRQLYSYKGNSRKVSEALQLTMLLNKDFAEAKSVLKSNDTLIFTSALKDHLQYFFNEDYITRHINSATDTFFYKTERRSEKFLNKPSGANNGLVDEIYFEILTDREHFEIFHAVKSYGADALVNEDNLKLNKSL